MLARASVASLLAVALASAAIAAPSFVEFESGQVRPLALSPDRTKLFAVNTPDDRLEVFAVDGSGNLTHTGSVAVGLEPVAVAARTNGEVWVVNHLSDSVSIVDVSTSPPRVVRTLLVGDEPRDIVFAGTGGNRAFITTAHRGQNSGVPPTDLTTEGLGRADVWVFDATNLGTGLGGTPLTKLTFFGDTPRALAASPSGNRVYAAVFHSGNRTATINELGVCNDASGAANNTIAPACTVNGVSLPGGTPNPDTNVEGVKGPEVGLVVKFNTVSGHWEDRLARAWDPVIKFTLPDEDVFVIDASANPPASPATGTQFFTGVGTILFNMITNPVTGKIYVTNTDARNEIRFEGPGTVAANVEATKPGTTGGPPFSVRGHLHEARVTVLDPTSGTVSPRHLNKHLDTAPSYAQPGATAKADSLATPIGMAVTADGTTLYVAAFGTGAVGMFDVAQLEADTFTPSVMHHIPVTGGGPSGLVLNEAAGKLYVLTRFDNSISVVDTGTNSEVAHLPVFNPEPASIVDGRRFLYDALATSSNGEASCASCHVFGDFDSLAWDLGNPDDDQLPDNNVFEFNLGCPTSFHPIKGPMTTQTLRGMANDGPMHWRGDRSGGNNPGGDPLDENAAFNRFIVAFDGLLGRGAPDAAVSATDMQEFADFILQVTMPPNPVRALDNSLNSDQAAGRSIFTNTGRLSDTIRFCGGCHTLDPANDHFGTQGRMSFEGEVQCFKIPQLRNMYQKVGMFGMPANSQIKSSPTTQGPNEFGPQGPQVRGFGFIHDGSVDRLFHFHRAQVFDLTETEALQMEQFMMAFDTDLAPIVGQQITLTSTNSAIAGPRINLLIARATLNECELVVKGNLAGAQRGWLRQANGTFKSDHVGDVALTDAQLRAQAASAGQERTYTCVPFGSGTRIGIDRDLDGCLDFDDGAPADPTTCAAGGSTTTTTTSPGSTTTTQPGSCTDVPVLDPKAIVKVIARNDAGRVTAKLVIDLAAYASDPITVSLADGDSPLIASQSVGALTPLGTSGKKWQFKARANGVQKVGLRNLAPAQTDKFKLSVKTKAWFTAAEANQSAANTLLTVRIGDLCFTHAATRKTD
jgi:YVTN family beta-propeller protein